MKILYLTDPAYDYLARQLYVGLCKTVGSQNVIVFPESPEWSAGEAIIKTTDSGTKGMGIDDVCSMLSAGMIDFVVASAPRGGVLAALATLEKRCTLPSRVLVDGEDDKRMRWDVFKRYKFDLYFKREFACSGRIYKDYVKARSHADSRMADRDRIHPLQFSVIMELVSPFKCESQDVDISFVGRASHRKRLFAVDLLNSLPDIRFVGGVYAGATDRRSKLARSLLEKLMAKFQGDPCLSEHERGVRLSPEEYFQLLARSKMGLSIRGGGFDTVRYWEVVAAKTVLVSEEPDIYIPDNFQHMRHAVFCKPNLSDLPDLVRMLSKDERARRSIIEEGYAHLLKHHTCERRAEYFLGICRSRL